MKKSIAINLIRSASVMTRINKESWTFQTSFSGEFAVINKAYNGVYFVHTKGNKATTHKTFMAAVASILDLYLSIIHDSMRRKIQELKSRYNSLETMRYTHKENLNRFVIADEVLDIMQGVNGEVVTDILTGNFATYRTELAAKAAMKHRYIATAYTLENVIDRMSKTTFKTLTLLQANLPESFKVTTFDA